MGHLALGKITFPVGITLYSDESGEGAFEKLTESQLSGLFRTAFIGIVQNCNPEIFLVKGYCRSSA